MFYRGCWHVVSRDLFRGYRPFSSPRKALYDPKAFIAHAELLHQAFAHCAIFPTAAVRRRLDRVSVPVWGATLSGPLPVLALVSHYLTNKLMGREPLPKRLAFLRTLAFSCRSLTTATTCGISFRFRKLFPTLG